MSYKKAETIQQHQENKKFNRVETVKKELNRNYRTEECSKRNRKKSAIALAEDVIKQKKESVQSKTGHLKLIRVE